MSNARLSLSVQGREEGVRTVVVSVGNNEYHLIAPTGKEAQNWYRKIQEKTEASRKLANQQSTKTVSIALTNVKLHKIVTVAVISLCNVCAVCHVTRNSVTVTV